MTGNATLEWLLRLRAGSRAALAGAASPDSPADVAWEALAAIAEVSDVLERFDADAVRQWEAIYGPCGPEPIDQSIRTEGYPMQVQVDPMKLTPRQILSMSDPNPHVAIQATVDVLSRFVLDENGQPMDPAQAREQLLDTPFEEIQRANAALVQQAQKAALPPGNASP